MKRRTILYVSLVVLFYSCIPQKNLEYLQSPIEEKSVYQTGNKTKLTIQPNDELLINVSSFDDVSFNFFETQRTGASMQASNELSINAFSYSVDDNGDIYFPIIGKISVLNLSIEEAVEKVKKELAPYFDQPNVNIKYAYKNIAILGEVRFPGYRTYTKSQINIFEALGLAGDMTLHGDRKELLIIRSDEKETTKIKIDLTNDEDVFSNYYLQPNDIIYVKSRKSVKWGVIATPASLIFSTITTALLVLNTIQTNNNNRP